MFVINAITWAIPIDVHRSIAHAEAYFEHSIAATAFGECAQEAQGQHAPVGKLPTEIVDMIAKEAARPCFSAYYPLWTEILECSADRCRPRERYPYEDIRDAELAIGNGRVSDDELRWSALHREDHKDARMRLLEMVQESYTENDDEVYPTFASFNEVSYSHAMKPKI